MNKRWMVLIGLVIILTGSWIYGSATWFLNVKPGLSIGDIQYADRKDRVTNLTAGALGTGLESAGLLTAPAYVAKNTMRVAAIHNFATLAASWTLSSDEALCEFLASTNASGSATVRLPATSGKKFFYRNGSGQDNVLIASGGATGVTVATATAQAIYYDGITLEYIKMGTAVVSP